MTILIIAGNTFRENVRDKILYNLILFALLMIVSAAVLGQLTLGHEEKVIIDLGLTAISIFGTLIAIFIGIGLVHKEMEKRTVYALLAKPLHRRDFILGKYFGLLLTLLVNVSIMTAGLVITMIYYGISAADILRMLPAVYLIYLSLALTTAVALVFSTFSTPALSAIFTLFIWIIGHFNYDLLQFSRITESGFLRWIFKLLYYALPNYANFYSVDSQNIIQSAAYFQSFSAAAVAWITSYGFLYSGILLMLSIAIFARRDFK
jgi:ABC-type transport system involved in multi-copper enzyme maturation permease subunit